MGQYVEHLSAALCGEDAVWKSRILVPSGAQRPTIPLDGSMRASDMPNRRA
jgi:hypothetical protein